MYINVFYIEKLTFIVVSSMKIYQKELLGEMFCVESLSLHVLFIQP